MKNKKIIKDFEMLLEYGFALPESYIEESDNGKYVYHGDGIEQYLSHNEALKLLKKMKSENEN